jgi:ATP-dependent Lhr-like helicase
LRTLGVRTFVSHSSLSLSERRQAEQAFGEDNDCVIVATSTLELGIDVGDLDYVIQIDAPSTVSSFMQRMGRTGRRAGSRRNYLFLATTDEALLIACGIARLWRDGYVEPVEPPPEPWHLVAQQAMALVLQHAGGLELKACREQLAELFPELRQEGIQDVLSFMLETGILAEQDGLAGFGQRGEKLYGRQNFLDLLSSFASPIQFQVMHGGIDLGVVDPLSLQTGDGQPCILLLGGRSWHVTSVDWPKRVAWVEPTREQGKARWMGTSRSLGYALCQAVRRILCGTSPEAVLSKRAHTRLEEVRSELPEIGLDGTIVEQMEGGRFRWWTFAGGRANATLAGFLRTELRSIRTNDFYLEAQGTLDLKRAGQVVSVADPSKWVGSLAKSGALNVKFIESLPVFAVTAMTAERVLDAKTAKLVVGG